MWKGQNVEWKITTKGHKKDGNKRRTGQKVEKEITLTGNNAENDKCQT
jgi:hypothetical protein